MFNVMFDSLLTIYRPYLLTLLGLIIVDLLLGVAAALKAGAFQWRRLADFYRTVVVPGLLGWLAFTVATYLVMPGLAGDNAPGFSQGITLAAWGTIVASLAASIGKSAMEVFPTISLPLPGQKPPQP